MSQQQPFKVLIVDDDKSMRQSLIELLEAAGWRVSAVSRATQVAEYLTGATPDVILSDVRMPGMSGLELLASLDKQIAPPVVIISAHGDIPMAVQAIQDGAYGFIEKPYEPRRLLTVLTHAAEQSRMRNSNARLKGRLLKLSGLDRILLGQTDTITALRQEVLDLADTSVAVLLQGDTGTGKELVAHALHDLGGTLFLDEICSCPLVVQAKLLRVIEDQQVLPVGAVSPLPVSFRVVSATNEDVVQAAEEGRLRQDLLFRLNTVVLTLPPLRQRRDDLVLLATHFLNEYAQVYEIDAPELNQDDLAALLAHDWPGNVRELRHVCERRILAARRGGGSVAQAIQSDQHFDDVPDTLREAVAAFERELIGKAIKAHKGRMDAAAEALGIGRRTLNEKIAKLGLDKEALL